MTEKLPLLPGSETDRSGGPKNRYRATGDVLLEPINGSLELTKTFINAITPTVEFFKS